MTCSNRTEAFVGETHTCHLPQGHTDMHSCGCGRTWHRLNEQGLTADDEPVQRKAGKRLSPERIEEFRYYVNAAAAEGSGGDRFPATVVAVLFGHIDAIESELASCRAGQPRHKDQA